MKARQFFSICGCITAALTIQSACGQSETRGVDVKGADVHGADVRGGSVTGGSVTGGSVTGGSVTGGSVTGGSVSGGNITPGTVTPGTVTAIADGRQIRVNSVDAVSINVNGGNADVKLGDRMLVIEKARAVLDGKPIAELPPNAKKVEVTVKDGMISIRSNGKQVANQRLE